MTKKKQIYKCNVCGNIVEVLDEGAGQLVCCGEAMELLEEKHKDEGNEKHVPIIKQVEGGYLISVGSVPHPMEETHYIEWIEIDANGISYKHFLKPGGKPEAVFCTDAKQVSARIYCNVHGLWMS